MATNQINPPMPKTYQPKEHEAKLYQMWEGADAFKPQSDKNPKANSPSFCIIMPPPNANDPLHVGHAMFVTLEDIMIRFHRMLKDNTLWLPGTDHAGIETQYVFEKKLAKQKQSRFNFDRETLYQKIFDYVRKNSQLAVSQIKTLGASADWSRLKFTLDEDVVEFVTETFEKLHQKNLIYRDKRLVNYCTKCGTSYSELEVDHKETISVLYYIKYGPLVVATTRPETKFADVALAVNPKDKRYQKYIGQEIEVECIEGKMKLPVIADEYVDPKFGTGVLKITPAHDPNDFEIGQKHNLPLKQVINQRGKLTDLAGRFADMGVLQAREAVVKALKTKNLLVKEEKRENTVGHCYRCGRVIEPLPLPQFFIRVKAKKNNLTQKALDLLDKKKIKIYGVGREKILRHWLKNLKDWNISRQIVWGIRVPVYYRVDGFEDKINLSFIDSKGKYHFGNLNQLLKKFSLDEIEAGLQNLTAEIGVEYVVSSKKPTHKGVWLPETDTLDTWFSSAQWPVVTLKTGKPGDFETFYPTSVMETGYDILPFWVMRMILMGVFLTNKEPFKEVYLHGLVRDEKGQKMSKSKGNVVNPLDVVEKYGADALRMALVIRSTPGQDKSVGEADFKAARNLTNKVWNASRYVIYFADNQKNQETNFNKTSQKKHEAAFLKHLDQVVAQTTKNLTSLKLGLTADYVYDQFWHWYCDQEIEAYKQSKLTYQSLVYGLTTFLKLLHPFIPFVTEAVWQELYQQKLVDERLLITSRWPNKND